MLLLWGFPRRKARDATKDERMEMKLEMSPDVSRQISTSLKISLLLSFLSRIHSFLLPIAPLLALIPSSVIGHYSTIGH